MDMCTCSRYLPLEALIVESGWRRLGRKSHPTNRSYPAMKFTPTVEKQIFQAVALARSLIAMGDPPIAACSLAATRFNVDRTTVEKLATEAIQGCRSTR